MSDRSISAYNNDEKVHRYDTDMDLLYPNHHKMTDISSEALPYSSNDRIIAFDIGIGYGFFTWKLLHKYPKPEVIGVDGSEAMIQFIKSLWENSHLIPNTSRRASFI